MDSLDRLEHRLDQIVQRITELGGRTAKDGPLASMVSDAYDAVTELRCEAE